MASPLRFGIILNEERLAFWERECLNALLKSGAATLDVIILPDRLYRSATKRKLENGIYYLFRLIFWRTKLFSTMPLKSSGLRFENIPRLKCEIIKSGKYSEHLGIRSLALLKERNLDFILKFGWGILRGDVLKLPRYGIWSFHHGDERAFRGRPAGFWEIFHRSPTTGVILQGLTDRLDGGVVLRRGRFKTNFTSYTGQLWSIYSQSWDFVAYACKALASNPSYLSTLKPEAPSLHIYKNPTNLEMLSMLMKIGWNRVRHIFYGIFILKKWSVGVAKVSASDFLDKASGTAFRWIVHPNKRSIYADPFILSRDDGLFLLAEELNYSDGRGSIVASRDAHSNSPRLLPLIKESQVHLSFPCFIEDGNHLYVLPERGEAGPPHLFEWNPNANSVSFVRCLISGVVAIDPILFFHNDLWWLAFTNGRDATRNRLELWYATSLNSEFHPHDLNPVKVDACAARAAGLPFRIDERLFRPTQNPGFSYGESIGIYEIKELNPARFEEILVKEITPMDPEYSDGIHQLSVSPPWIAIDSCRNQFDLTALIVRLRMRIQRKWRI